MQNKIYLLMAIALVFASCTDLKIEESDSIFAEASSEFTGVADVASSIDNLYNGMNGQMGDQGNYFAMQEVTTDEQLVPTRGTDWGDNGVWRTLHQHTWNAAHGHLINVWNQFNQNIFLCNEILDSRSNPTAAQVAEAKFIRAWSMYAIMDFFGSVPFREVDEGPDVNPKVLSRSEAYDFVKQDLTDAIAGLPSVGPGTATNRASKATANFLMARLLLNAHIYNGTGAANTADMTGVIAAVDAIAADGFALESGYFNIFTEAVDNETIWFLPTGVGNRIWNGLHYNQGNSGGGWNGFTTLAEFYDSFEGNANSNNVGDGQEERRGWVPDATNADPSNLGIGFGFLIGQQYGEDGVALTDRAGDPLVFTKELPGLVGNNERTGIRVIKYHPGDGSAAFTNHEIIFRYADAHLMKAEAMLRSSGDATALVNELRTLRGASTLSSVSESDLLAERGREMYVEFTRRMDLIRFGQFTRNWEFKDPSSVDDVTKNLFPIPSNALLSNPNLVQNPGY